MEAKFNKCQTPLEELHLEDYPNEVREPKNYTVYRHISPGGNDRENTLHGYIFIYKDNVATLSQRLERCKNHWKKYKIVQYKDNKIVNAFDSIRGAGRATGVNPVCIRLNIKGKLKHAGNYIWRKIKVEESYGSKMEQMPNTA